MMPHFMCKLPTWRIRIHGPFITVWLFKTWDPYVSVYYKSFWNDGLLIGFPHSLYFKHHFRLFVSLSANLFYIGKSLTSPRSNAKEKRRPKGTINLRSSREMYSKKRALLKARFTNTPCSYSRKTCPPCQCTLSILVHLCRLNPKMELEKSFLSKWPVKVSSNKSG